MGFFVFCITTNKLIYHEMCVWIQGTYTLTGCTNIFWIACAMLKSSEKFSTKMYFSYIEKVVIQLFFVSVIRKLYLLLRIFFYICHLLNKLSNPFSRQQKITESQLFRRKIHRYLCIYRNCCSLRLKTFLNFLTLLK